MDWQSKPVVTTITTFSYPTKNASVKVNNDN